MQMSNHCSQIMMLRSKLKTKLDPMRYEHSLSVSFTCMNLAMRYGYDIDKAELAGLMHDCGKRFTDELQPRDLLSEAIWKQMEADGTDYVWEDMRPIGKETILQHFPNIYEHCLEEGFDVLKEPIPVVPAQHYHMGGIAVNLASETSMDGLYAVGEASCNGVHGKNRLASNSLLESLVFAQRAADDILFGSRHQGCDAGTVHMEEYEDMEQLFGKYRSMIFSEIEREKNCAQ